MLYFLIYLLIGAVIVTKVLDMGEENGYDLKETILDIMEPETRMHMLQNPREFQTLLVTAVTIATVIWPITVIYVLIDSRDD